MESPIPSDDTSRHDATERDRSRHSLTVKQASQRFADFAVPRSPRSVQRFCDHGHIDCISVKGEKTERYFIDPASVERYAHELKAVEQISRVGDDTARHDATGRDATRHDATERVMEEEPPQKHASEPDTRTSNAEVKHLEDEMLHLRIDNRAKEQVINMLRDERVAMASRLEEVNYLLGAAESKMAQLEAPKPIENTPERDASRRDSDAIEGEATDAVIDEKPEPDTPPTPARQPEPTPEPEPEVKRSLFGRLFK